MLLWINQIFRPARVTARPQIAEGDASVESIWLRIRDRLSITLKMTKLSNVESVAMSELRALKQILEVDVPKLRRLAAPLDYSDMARRGYTYTGAQ